MAKNLANEVMDRDSRRLLGDIKRLAGVDSGLTLLDAAGAIRDFMKKKVRKPVFVGMPTRGEVSSAWLDMYWTKLRPYEHPADYWRTAQGTLVHDQRNSLVRHFLDTQYEWMLQSDDDVLYLGEFDPFQHMQALAEKTGAKIISGPCPLTTKPHNPNVYLYLNADRSPGEDGKRFIPVTEYTPNTVMECHGVGGAWLFVHRDVYKALGTDKWFRYEGGMSEDLYFSHTAQEAGFKILADFRLQLGHLKKMAVTMDWFQGARVASKLEEQYLAGIEKLRADSARNVRDGNLSPYLQEKHEMPPQKVAVRV